MTDKIKIATCLWFDKNAEEAITHAMMTMKKIDIAKIEAARRAKSEP